MRSEAAAEGTEGTAAAEAAEEEAGEQAGAEAAEERGAEAAQRGEERTGQRGEERTEEMAAVAAAPGSPAVADAVAVGDADDAAWVEGGRVHASRAASLTDSSLRQTVASVNFWLIFFAVFAEP